MRNAPTATRIAGAALLGLLAWGATACDLNDPDEVQNSSNFAIVKAQFFASRISQTPVPGVRMVVESDPDAERPYNGPDVIAISGEDGVAVARVFPGLQEQEGDGGGDGGTGSGTPTAPNPLELPPPLVFADVAVTIVYNGQIVSFVGGGLTVGSGRLYDLGPVFLVDDFGMVVN